MQGGPVSSGGPRKGPGGPLTVADLLEGAQRAAAAAAAGAAVPAAGAEPPSSPAVSQAVAAAAEAEEGLGLSLAIPSVESQGPFSGALVGPPSGTPTRRLMIEKVVLEDFKSYNKKRVIGPFHKRFTAIVGPNGSGKSNVIDAMLFVFGRRAQQIRLRKVTELIHNSAAATAAADDSNRPKKKHANGDLTAAAAEGQQENPPPIDRASVSVFFQEIIDRRMQQQGLQQQQQHEQQQQQRQQQQQQRGKSHAAADPESDEFEVVEEQPLSHSSRRSRTNRNDETQGFGPTPLLFLLLLLLCSCCCCVLAAAATLAAAAASSAVVVSPCLLTAASCRLPSGRPEETGLLEYLEDLIGSSRFVEPIKQAQEHFDESCHQEKANRMRCAAAELRRLEGPKDEALASLKTNREAAAAKVILAAVYRRVLFAAAALAAAANAVAAAVAAQNRAEHGRQLLLLLPYLLLQKRRIESEETEKKLRETQQSHKAAEEKLEGLKAALQKIEEDTAAQAEQLKAAETECAGADSALQKLVRQDDELRAELRGELSRLEEKKQQLQQLETRQQKQQEHLQQLEASLQQRDAGQDACKVREAEETVEKAKAAVQSYTESIKGDIKRLSDNHAAAEKLLLLQQQQLDKHLTETAKVTSALELLERKERQLVERQQQTQAALKRLLEGETANAAALQQQQQQQASAAAELVSLRKQKEEATQTIARLENDMTSAKGQLKRAEQQRQETRCSSRLVSLLAQEKRQQRLKGLLDRLVSRPLRFKHILKGSSDRKRRGFEVYCQISRYEKAFLAASGGFSSFYVVEDPADARELFALLRQHELGRCNVLALRVLERELSQRMQEADAEASRWTDSSSPRLIDLLQFSSPRIRVAFFKAVGSTRVARDIEHATHIAYTLRQRVVTLEGGLIELDGRLRRAALAVSSDGDAADQQQLQQLQQTISLTQNQLKEARHKKGLVFCGQEQLEQTEKHLERQRAEAEAAIELLQQNISSADMQKKELRRRLDAQKGDTLSKKETAQLQELKASVASAAEAQKALHEAVKKQEATVSQLLEELQNAGGEKMRKLRKQLLQAERTFNRLRDETARQEAEVAAGRAEAQRSLRDKQRLQREKRGEELRVELGALEEKARVVVTAKEEAAEKKKALLTQIKQTQKQQQQAEETLKASSLASLETQHLLQTLQQQHQQQQQQVKHHQQQLHASLQRLMEIDATITAEEEQEQQEQQDEQQQQQEQHDDGKAPLALTDGSPEAEQQEQQQQQQQQQQQGGADLQPEEAAVLQRLRIDLSDAALARHTAADLEQLQQQQQQQQQASLHALQLYGQKRLELRKKETEARDASALREAAKSQLETFKRQRESEFLAAFSIIAGKLKETYRMLSQGGDAELELADPADPFAEGVLLSVRPPKKSWRQIQNLSGGERTLSSLSLVFALHHYKPTCVYFLDEIDAALDHRNVAILGAFILQKTRDAQFIIISLRNQLFELANRLVGIYKTFDATKSVTLDPARLAAEEDENSKPGQEGPPNAASMGASYNGGPLGGPPPWSLPSPSATPALPST
ncbi:hypothetical protein Emed_004123 [Eimeria media]